MTEYFSDPNDKAGREEDEESFDLDNDTQLSTLHDMLYTTLKLLELKGYTLKQNPVGAWAGFDVYTAQPIMLDGIECDVNIKKKMPEYQNSVFLNAVKLIVQNEISGLDPEKHKSIIKKWLSIYQSFERPKWTNSPVFQVSFTFAEDWTRPISFKPVDGCYKLVPTVEMLPKNVRSLDVNELLHLLPDAEREMFILALGRAVVGANGTNIYGTAKQIKHGWRGWFLLQSAEAQIGKSTFMELLAKVLTEFGYVVSDLPPRINSSFGWYDVAVADVVIVDDINEDNQKFLMRCEPMKKIASGNKLTTEEKGIKSLPPVQSTAILIGATNTYRQSHFINLDNGSTSRANILCCVPGHTLPQGDSTIVERWLNIAAKYECSWDCLMVALLAHAGKVFNEALRNQQKLTKRYTYLRENYVNKPGVTYIEDIVKAAEKLTAICISDLPDDEVDIALDYVQQSGFTGEHLLAVIHASLAGKEIQCKDISRGFVRAFQSRYTDLRAKLDNGSKNVFEEIASSVMTTEGWHLPKTVAMYTACWDTGRVKAYMKQVNEMDNNALKQLRREYDLAPIQDLLKNMQMVYIVGRRLP